MCSKAPFHFEPGLEQFEGSTSHVLSSYGYSFDLTGEIEGFVSTYVMTRKYNGALFLLSVAALRCPIVSRSQCASIPHNPVCSHPLQKSGEQEPERRLEGVQLHMRNTVSGWHLHSSHRRKKDKDSITFVI